jgi:50S ribosomal subunit-associated GTPase HflX
VETSVDEIHVELAKMEAAEARLSAERSRLQDQIDFGFGTDTTREREREVSDERQQVHERIDALRKQLRKQQLA